METKNNVQMSISQQILASFSSGSSFCVTGLSLFFLGSLSFFFFQFIYLTFLI